MADYYTKFSIALPLPNAAAQSCALGLAAQASRMQRGGTNAVPDDFPASLRAVIEDWRFDTATDGSTPWGIWLDSYNGGIDAVCAFIRHLLRKFNPEGRVTLEWSFDCSRPRTDAYGGGAAIITAKRIKSMSTTEWLAKHARQSALPTIIPKEDETK